MTKALIPITCCFNCDKSYFKLPDKMCRELRKNINEIDFTKEIHPNCPYLVKDEAISEKDLKAIADLIRKIVCNINNSNYCIVFSRESVALKAIADKMSGGKV